MFKSRGRVLFGQTNGPETISGKFYFFSIPEKIERHFKTLDFMRIPC